MIELFSIPHACCGCGACADICPKEAITIQRKDGFDYPVVNQNLCVGCGRCKSVCTFQKEKVYESNCIAAYACKSRDSVRMCSSSGGVFTAVSDFVLNMGGVVYGASFDEAMVLKHTRTTDTAGRDSMRGSKYIQSSTVGVFRSVMQDLRDDKYVLFTGTPCQVAALKSFLGREYDHLVCVDIICHGVPSPEVWERFVQYIEKKYSGQLTDYAFRNKTVAWRRYSPTATFADGRMVGENDHTGSFIELFRYDVCLRPSCTSCRYASVHREGDLTIGDFWGIENVFPQLDDNKGVSALMVNTEKGVAFLRQLQADLELIPCTQEQIATKQPNMFHPSRYSNKAAHFQRDYRKIPFPAVLRKYTRVGFKRRIIDEIKRIMEKEVE